MTRLPIGNAGLPFRSERWRIPALARNQSTGEPELFLRRTQSVASAVTGDAMAETFDEVGAPVPLGWFGRIGNEAARFERKRTPDAQRGLRVVREAQFVRSVGRWNWRHATQVGINRVRVLAGDTGEVRIRKSRIQQAAILRSAVTHRAPEMGGAPATDTALCVRRQVAGEDGAERGFDAEASCIRSATACGVATSAVASESQVSAAFDL